MPGHFIDAFQLPGARTGTVPMRRAYVWRGIVDARAVMIAASALEGDIRRVIAWFVEDPIACLGGRTAAELVSEGHGALVVGFLRGIYGRGTA